VEATEDDNSLDVVEVERVVVGAQARNLCVIRRGAAALLIPTLEL